VKIGDIVKLIAKPQVDWMLNYLDKTFQVLDFPTETGVEVMMVGSRPEWVWATSKTVSHHSPEMIEESLYQGQMEIVSGTTSS